MADAPFYLSDDVGEQEAQRRAAFQATPFGWVDSKLKGASDWIKGVAKRRQPTSEVSQLPFSSVSPVELIPMMALEGGRTVNRWLYGTKDPSMLRPEDTLAPTGAGAMAAPFVAAKHGVSLGSAGGRAAKEALDMSEAARMARAKEMGFDTERTLYHGTTNDFDAFRVPEPRYSDQERAVWLSESPHQASSYAGARKAGGFNSSMDLKEAIETGMPVSGKDGGRVIPAYVSGNMKSVEMMEPAYRDYNAALVDAARAEGYDGLRMTFRSGDPTEYAIFDPSNIRSTQAAFDPAQADSANLLAADITRSSMPAIVTEGMRSAGELNKAPFQPESIRAYHGSQQGQPQFHEWNMTEIGPHFGTAEQANGRLEETGRTTAAGNAPAVTPVDMRFKNPLDIEDPGQFDAFNLPPALEATGKLRQADIDRLMTHGDRAVTDMDVFSADLREAMRNGGYDALRYRNAHEGVGGDFSYVPMERNTVFSATTGERLFQNPGTEQILDILRAQQQLQGPFQEE